MATFRISSELNLIHGEEIHRTVKRHRLHRAEEIRRLRGDDLLFAGDQRHPGRAEAGHRAFIVFPGQEPQREAEHAAGMAKHAFQRVPGLAGVGGAEDSPGHGIQ